MSIRRRKKTRQFTQIDNAALRNPDLSLKAKGLLAVMMSCPEDWKFYMNWLQQQSSDGKEAHQSAMKELERHGYVVRERANGERGRLEWEYLVDDEPAIKPDSTMTGFPPHGDAPTMTGFTVHGSTVNGSTVHGEPATTNTDSTNTDLTNTEDTKREAPAAPARREPTQDVPETGTPTQTPAADAAAPDGASQEHARPVQDQPTTQERQTTQATGTEQVPAGRRAAPTTTEAYLRRKLSSAFVDRVLGEVQPLGVDRRRDWFTLPLERAEQLVQEAQATHTQFDVKVPTRLRDLLDEECRRVNTTLRATPTTDDGEVDMDALMANAPLNGTARRIR